MPTPTVSAPKNASELSRLMDILSESFNFPREKAKRYQKLMGPRNFRVIRSGSTIMGGLGLIRMGQFFGGKSVPMTGIGAVGIAPEHRGSGAATMLMKAALREIRAERCPLSVLYPATLPLYRRVGYEQAGARNEIRISIRSIRCDQRDTTIEIRSVMPKDHAAIRKAYNAHAQRTSGNLDRGDFIWQRVGQPRDQVARGYMAVNRQTDRIEAYAYCMRVPSQDAAYSLQLSDLVSLTPAAGRRLLAFFADHQSMADALIFQGSEDDPILKLLPERRYASKLLDHWMLRIVDVKASLAGRGYSPIVTAEVHFDVVDDSVFPVNNGRCVLTVNDGRARVSSGGRGDLKIGIRGLAALYTGHMSPHDLITTGLMQIGPRASSESLSSAAALFAGPRPWIGDMF